MNKIMNNPFLAKCPILDIHGETGATCIAVIDAFLKDCINIKKDKCVIVHGKGQGVLKNATKEYLKHDKRVDKFYIDGFNDGQTIVELKRVV